MSFRSDDRCANCLTLATYDSTNGRELGWNLGFKVAFLLAKCCEIQPMSVFTSASSSIRPGGPKRRTDVRGLKP